MTNHKAIVIGVSSGGMQALAILLPAFPEKFSVPVIVVQHRIDEPDSFLEKYLNQQCKLNVVEAKPNEKITPSTIYFAPGGYHLMVEQEFIFSFSVDAPVHYSIPSIDVLFESAADVYKEKLIGVILTGANADGSNGLKKLRDLGGLGVVQDPETADCRTMPDSAIKIAGADYILALADIGSFLVETCDAK